MMSEELLLTLKRLQPLPSSLPVLSFFKNLGVIVYGSLVWTLIQKVQFQPILNPQDEQQPKLYFIYMNITSGMELWFGEVLHQAICSGFLHIKRQLSSSKPTDLRIMQVGFLGVSNSHSCQAPTYISNPLSWQQLHTALHSLNA